MSFQPKRVVVVKGYSWGAVSQEEADDTTADTFVRSLERAMAYDYDTKAEVAAAIVEVVGRDDLEEKIRVYPGPEAVVFPSRGALDVAKELAARRRDLKVVVLTGLIPKEEVVLLSKRCSPDTICDVVLNG